MPLLTPITRNLRLPPSAEAAAQARRAVTDLVPHDQHLADRGRLLITEAVTNAVQHTDSEELQIQLRLDPDTGELLCAVLDCDPTAPEHRPARGRKYHPRAGNAAGRVGADGLAESGRGLGLIDSLSQIWGFSRRDHGKWTWFQLVPEPGPDTR